MNETQITVTAQREVSFIYAKNNKNGTNDGGQC
jgi:hypothetical protein